MTPQTRHSNRWVALCAALAIVVGLVGLVATLLPSFGARQLSKMLAAVAPPGTQIDGLVLRLPARVTIDQVSLPLNDTLDAPRLVVHDVSGSTRILSLLRREPVLKLRAGYREGTIAVVLEPYKGEAGSVPPAGALAVQSEVRDVHLGALASAFGVRNVTGTTNLDLAGIIQPENLGASVVSGTLNVPSVSLPEVPVDTVVLPPNPNAVVAVQWRLADGALRAESASLVGPAYQLSGRVQVELRQPFPASPISGEAELRLKHMPKVSGTNPDDVAITKALLALLIQAKVPVQMKISGVVSKPEIAFDLSKTMAVMAGQ